MTEASYRKYSAKILRALADRIESGHFSSYKESGHSFYGPKKIADMVDYAARSLIIPKAKEVKKI